jgi:hypothetical protein
MSVRECAGGGSGDDGGSESRQSAQQKGPAREKFRRESPDRDNHEH